MESVSVLPPDEGVTPAPGVSVSHPDIKDVCKFLAEYASRLLGCGATCIRLQRNVTRMAEAMGYEVVMTILPKHINVAVSATDGSECFTYLVATCEMPISFNVNTRLSELSWDVADGKLDFDAARESFRQIIATPTENCNLVLLLGSLANASFCRLFGGDWIAVATVFLATFAGLLLKQILLERRTDTRVVFIICAFVSSVLAAGDSLFGIGSTAAVAVSTSVLYLVPGIPFINSFSDLLTGNYICAFCRFTHAVILTFCLSLGLCGGMLMMNLGMF